MIPLHVHLLFLCRIFRQKQYEEQREREFMDALNKEAVSVGREGEGRRKGGREGGR